MGVLFSYDDFILIIANSRSFAWISAIFCATHETVYLVRAYFGQLQCGATSTSRLATYWKVTCFTHDMVLF